ncbi:MAG: ComF family protein [Cytophagales bacterium]|nr:ComF family protein [Cytophagales bacterium]
MKLINDLLNIIFPRLCCICEEALTINEELLCFHCRSELPKTNSDNYAYEEFNSRLFGKLNTSLSVSYLYFYKSGITQKLLHQLKYKNFPELGFLIGNWFGHELQQRNFLDHVEVIIPVPLHPKKERKRMYNQSAYFARGISEVTNIPVDSKSLKRIDYNKSQTSMSKEQRWESVKHAFKVFQSDHVANKNILLVDDIVTTGATLEACGHQLYKHRASSISVATIALAK